MTEEPRRSLGMPIEEAPLWVLAIFTVILWLVCFPALVGLLDGLGLYRGWRGAAVGAAGLALVLVIGLATRKPWVRRPEGDPRDERPLFVRFSTWLWTAVLFPNVLQGVLILGVEGPPPDYWTSLAIGLLVSAIHGAFALADRLKRFFQDR